MIIEITIPQGQIDKIVRNMDVFDSRVAKAAVASVIETGLMVQAASVRGCPIKYGNLRASAHTTWKGVTNNPSPVFDMAGRPDLGMRIPDRRIPGDHAQLTTKWTTILKELTVVVGHTVLYAHIVHELPTAGTTIYPNGAGGVGGWHFLINALRMEGPKLPDVMAKRINSVVGSF